MSSTAATVTLIFPQPSNLAVTVVDGKTLVPLAGQDYRWIIEEDRTFYIDPTKTTNTGATIVPTFGTNFHTSYMPVVATGCTGPLSCESGQSMLGMPVVCDGGNGVCRTTASQQTAVNPSQVHLDPTKRYYISVLPGDAANSFENVNSCLDACNSFAVTAWAVLLSASIQSPISALGRYCFGAVEPVPAVQALGVRLRRRLPAQR